VGIGLNAFMIGENFKSLKLRDLAVKEKTQAEKSTLLAERELEQTEVELQQAETKRQQAEKVLVPLQNEIAQQEKRIEEFPAKLKQVKNDYEQQVVVEKEKLASKLTLEQDKFASKLKLEQNKFDKQLEVEQEKHDSELTREQDKHDRQLSEEKVKFGERLEKEQKKFEAETSTLVEQKEELNQQVSDLNESSKLLRYKSGITNVVQKLQAGDYRETRQLLDGIADQSPWEVARH